MSRTRFCMILLLPIILIACGGSSVNRPVASTAEPSGLAASSVSAETAAPTQSAKQIISKETSKPALSSTTVFAPTPEPVPTPTRSPTATPEPLPTPTPSPTSTPEFLFYNLPTATLTYSTGLFASPNRPELIVPVPIPAGNTVYVMGRNATSSHLRVVFGTGVGWVPVSFTDYNGRQDKLEALPVFTREPPSCAVPITTQFGLNSTWTSDRKQRIAVVVDLFRSRYGDFPPSYLSLTVNGREVESTQRQIVERGQFSLKDVVFTLPGYVQPGDTLGYLLDTSSDEPLSFMATIFSVPENCKWDTK